MALSISEINALAHELYLPQMTVNFGDEDIVLKMLMRKGKKLDGGPTIRHSIIYQYNKGGAFTRGTVFDVSGEPNVTAAELTWRYYNWPITLFLQDELEVAGAAKAHDIMESKFKAARRGATEMLADHLFTGGGTDSSTVINELDHALDDGSGTALQSSTTYAGINKATETWWAGNVYSAGGNGKGPVYTHLNLAWMKAVDGNVKPTLVVANTQTLGTFMLSQQSAQQYINDDLTAGFMRTSFNGIPFVADNHIPVSATETANRVYFLNEDYINLFVHSALDMKFVPWAEPYDQAAKVAHIRWAGNLLVTDPTRHCVMYDFDYNVNAA